MKSDKNFQEYNLDDPETTMQHRKMLLEKPFLKRLYTDWYNIFHHKINLKTPGLFLELGSGGGFLKDVFPEVITSDILELECVDMMCNAENLPFENESLSGIMMLNVFHHIPSPHLFLKEAERTLRHGGKVVMIEPANSFWGRFVYKHFHHEPFDPKGEMEIESGRPLSNSNQALPYIFFERESKSFTSNYPQLRIVSISYHTPFRYIISGGFSHKAMLPAFMYPVVKGLEFLLSSLSRALGLFCTIELEK
ncbi:MAG: class I SAM-dependent methyltransferase [Bacteroidales bacterium]|jgi:SAM-dependent methyltransferase|nr:class I SAM-dependent methyltransferase [Bacteroidales bacterium]